MKSAALLILKFTHGIGYVFLAALYFGMWKNSVLAASACFFFLVALRHLMDVAFQKGSADLAAVVIGLIAKSREQQIVKHEVEHIIKHEQDKEDWEP